jgi:hypothetical protein
MLTKEASLLTSLQNRDCFVSHNGGFVTLLTDNFSDEGNLFSQNGI